MRKKIIMDYKKCFIWNVLTRLFAEYPNVIQAQLAKKKLAKKHRRFFIWQVLKRLFEDDPTIKQAQLADKKVTKRSAKKKWQCPPLRFPDGTFICDVSFGTSQKFFKPDMLAFASDLCIQNICKYFNLPNSLSTLIIIKNFVERELIRNKKTIYHNNITKIIYCDHNQDFLQQNFKILTQMIQVKNDNEIISISIFNKTLSLNSIYCYSENINDISVQFVKTWFYDPDFFLQKYLEKGSPFKRISSISLLEHRSCELKFGYKNENKIELGSILNKLPLQNAQKIEIQNMTRSTIEITLNYTIDSIMEMTTKQNKVGSKTSE